MTKCILRIIDEVNVKFEGLPPEIRRKLIKAVEYYVPGAQYSPQVKLGRWSGKISYFDQAGRTYLNLLDRLLPILQKEGYECEVIDERDSFEFKFDEINVNSYSHIAWPEGHQKTGEPIILRDHQVTMINNFLNNPQGIHVASTGSGKSISSAILSHKCEPYGRTIVIVPSKDLVTQTEEYYVNLGLDVGAYYGDRKDIGKTHTICTWQSLEMMHKKSKDPDCEITITDFLEGVVCVMSDECHRSAAACLQKLLSGPFAKTPIRWGLTGTMPEEDIHRTALISCLGVVIGRIEAFDLQEKGILANLHVSVWQLKDLGAAFDNYQSELKWLTTNKKRIEFLANKITAISLTGNTLVLVDRIQTGEMLQLLIPNSVFIEGSMKSKDRKAEYNEIANVDGRILIGTYGCVSTGIDVVRIFNLFLFEAGKSFTRTIQSIGRGLRVADDKDFVNVYDICSNCKFSKKHLTARKKHYTESQYPYTIEKIDY